jgi:hypothetical protein
VERIGPEMPRGSFYSFLEPDGAGNPVRPSRLTGLLRPSSGWIRVRGKDPNGDVVAAKERVGVVPDSERRRPQPIPSPCVFRVPRPGTGLVQPNSAQPSLPPGLILP